MTDKLWRIKMQERLDPYRTNPEREFDHHFTALVANARKEYGTLWMYDELIATLEFLNEKFPIKGNNFLEIGSAQGASFHCFSTLFNGKKISVDYPFNKGQSSIGIENSKLRHEHWTKYFNDVTSISGKSQDIDTIEQVKTALNGELLDWLFIDGDHDYAAVIQDYELYKDFVAPGGFIGFHDVFNPHPEVQGAVQAWKEISNSYEGQIWQTDWNWCGVGILYV